MLSLESENQRFLFLTVSIPVFIFIMLSNQMNRTEQIVPTLYRFKNGTTIQTYQYSVTEHLRMLNPGSARGLPGVFFFYEVSPLHVEISEGYRKGWIAFFTSVCAIVGGVVTCMGMLDQWLFGRAGRGRDSLAL